MRHILIIIFLSNFLYSQGVEPKEAPLNPHFIKYLEDNENGKLQKINSAGYYNSIIPHPTMLNIEKPGNFKTNASLPDRYDLRTEGFVTPIKDQGDCGSCWLFSTMASLESYWKKLGLGTYDLSENHAGNEWGYEDDPCLGGNPRYLTPYFIRGNGPISEAEDPYILGKNRFKPLFSPQAIVTDERILPKDINVIKQCIIDYGGITSSIDWFGDFDDYFNQTDNTYFFSSSDTDISDASHCILLVGWDDNMQTAGGTGAWIVKNSWGNDFGEDGYFYLSYQDIFFNAEGFWPICWPGRIEYSELMSIYYYDKFGWIGTWGWKDGTDYALVKFTLNDNETLARIGSYVVSSDATVKFEFYDSFYDNSLGNKLGSTQAFSCDYPGYYSFELQQPLVLNAGQELYVKVEYNTPNCDHPIPVERYIEDWTWNYNPQIETDCFWISSTGEQNTWFENGNDISGREIDPCVKLYTNKSGGGAISLTILDEGFDTATFPPTGWTQTITNQFNTWMSGNPISNNFSTIDPSSQNSAICPYDVKVYQQEYIYTPVFALPNGTASLEFYSGYSTAWLTGATMTLWISTDGGASWPQTPIWQAINDGQGWGWRKQELDLSAYADNQNVRLAWGYVGQDGDLVGLDGVKLIANGTVGVENDYNKSKKFDLEQNYPNPFNPSTIIYYTLPEESMVSFKIYDMLGREINQLVSSNQTIGKHRIQWNGIDKQGQRVPAGIYIYQLQAGDVVQTKKMVLMK